MNRAYTHFPNCPTCGEPLPFFDVMKAASSPRVCSKCGSKYKRDIDLRYLSVSFVLMYLTAKLPLPLPAQVASLAILVAALSIVEWRKFVRLRSCS